MFLQAGHQQYKTVNKDSSDDHGEVEESMTTSWLGEPRRLQKNASFVSSDVQEADKIDQDDNIKEYGKVEEDDKIKEDDKMEQDDKIEEDGKIEENDKIEQDVTNPWLDAARRLQQSLNSFSSALSRSAGNQAEGAASNMASQHEHETVPALQVRPEQI